MTEPSDAYHAAIALLTDDELARMTDRAYREAARCWRALQRSADRAYTPDDWRTLRARMYDDATSADEWHATLRAEQRRRVCQCGDPLAHGRPDADRPTPEHEPIRPDPMTPADRAGWVRIFGPERPEPTP